MKIYHFFVVVACCLLPQQLLAKAFDWYRGGEATYTIQKKHSPVVDKATEMFASDMLALTGKGAKSSSSGDVLLYQLDMATNKDMKVLGTMRIPLLDFIAKKDAFWLGVRNGKVVIVGSNGRGTAYGLMYLSQLSGIDTWSWWAGIAPAKRKRLTIDDKLETTQTPTIDYRAISLENNGETDYDRLFQLMLRLHANTLCEGWDRGEAPSHFLHNLKDGADSYGIILATPHGSHGLRLIDHKKGSSVDIGWTDDNYGYMEPLDDEEDEEDNDLGAVYHLSYQGAPHDYLWLPTAQPALIVNEMTMAYNHGARQLWMVALNNPTMQAYPLSLVMDMAWNIDNTTTKGVKVHIASWLTTLFGKSVADALANPVREYYRLVGIRRPECMDFSIQQTPSKGNSNGDGGVKNTDFNAEEFGNELDCYLNDYSALCKTVDKASHLVPNERKDLFFTTIYYPVRSAALMAVKTLQAQESRLISRPVSFHIDEEALESAAKSIKAYQEQQRLNTKYNEIMKATPWRSPIDAAPHELAVFGKPVLPDTLSDKEVEKYGKQEASDAHISDDNTIVRNAFEYTKASSDAKRIDMLGRSMKAVEIGEGGELSYNFHSGVLGGVLRLAFIPTHDPEGKSLQCSVSIDGNTPTTIIITDGSRSDKWAEAVLRGQSLIELPISLAEGMHTLTIKALDNHVIFDQWMIDKDTDRQFYLFPKK